MFRRAKIDFAAKVVEKVQDKRGIVLCSYDQLAASDLANIRLSIRKSGALMQIGSKGVLKKGFEIAANNRPFAFNLPDALKEIRGPTALIFFENEILGTLASLNEASKKYPGQIQIIGLQLESKNLSKIEIEGMSKYKSTPELFQGIYSLLTTAISTLVICLKGYYKEILEEGTKMITKTEIEAIIKGESASKEAKELATATLQLSQGDLYSMLNLIQKIMQDKFGFTIGAVAAASPSGASSADEQPTEKKEFKLKVVNVDSADKLKAAKMVQELFEKGNKPIAKLIEASKMLTPSTIFDLNPIPSDEAQVWVDKFAELGVVMEKI